MRELDVAAIRVVIRTSNQAILGALDDFLPFPKVGGASLDSEEIELDEGPTVLLPNRADATVDVTAGELPSILRGLLGAALERRGGAILHGAAVLVGSQAVLCIAPSEGGKTTLCGKVAGRLPVLSDETIALRLDGPTPRVSGTPFWSGPPLPTATGLFPLAAICFLRKGSVGLKPKAQSEALVELLREWHLAERAGASSEALTKAATLLSRVPAFDLHSTLESDPLPLLQKAAT